MIIGWGQIASEVVSYSLGARHFLRQKMIVEKTSGDSYNFSVCSWNVL